MLKKNNTTTTNEMITMILLFNSKIGRANKQAIEQIFEYTRRNRANAEKLIEATQNGDNLSVKNLLVSGVSVNYQDTEGNTNTALHYAVQAGHQAIIELLLALPQQQLLPNQKGELPEINAKTTDINSHTSANTISSPRPSM